MNTRANIMYFIEHFLDSAQRDGHVDYVRMMERDIIRVVDAVAPDDGSGAANVKVVRKASTFLPFRGLCEIRADSRARFCGHYKAKAIWVRRLSRRSRKS